MSANNAPPNPGQPRGPMNTGMPKPTRAPRPGPWIVLAGIVAGVGYVYSATRPPQPKGTPEMNPLSTPGVKNIEGAYQSGGATATHTKGYGGTMQGEKDDIPRKGEGSYGTGKEKGFGEEGMGDDQRSEAGKVGKKWNDMKHGDEKGK